MIGISTAVITLALAAATLAPGPASAVSVVRLEQNAAGVCQGALPAFAGTLRARPLALQNEGTTPAFVTCSFQGQTMLSGGTQPRIERLRVYFRNDGTAARTFSCTLVDGQWESNPTYVVKTVTLGGGGNLGSIFFELTDYEPAVTAMKNPNLSCNLPADVGLTTIWTNVFYP